MKYAWFNDYCLAKKGAVYDYKLEWEAGRYRVGGKMFVMVGGDKEGKPIAHNQMRSGVFPAVARAI